MSHTKFNHVKIAGISVVVPEKEINIYDEAHYYDNNVKKIDRMRRMVGFHKRRVVDDNTTPSDLGIEAAKNLIQEMNIKKEEIDALVYVVQVPDYTNPATAFYIHRELGLFDRTPAFDINMGCAGWVYGMWTASQMIESRACKKVLLICADTPARGMNPDNRTSAPLFGDAGCATLVEFSEEKILSHYNIETKTSGFEALIPPMSGARMLPARIADNDDDWEWMLSVKNKKIDTPEGFKRSIFGNYMDGLAVFDFTMNVVPQNIKSLMEFAQVEEKDIDTLLLHQANKQIVETVGTGAGFPTDKVPYHAFENYGNNTMCSIATNIASILKEKTENNVLDVLASGFGNGLTCASAILKLDHIHNSGVKTYYSPKNKPTKDELVERWLNKMAGTK